jgi:hypothetical protein
LRSGTEGCSPDSRSQNNREKKDERHSQMMRVLRERWRKRLHSERIRKSDAARQHFGVSTVCRQNSKIL